MHKKTIQTPIKYNYTTSFLPPKVTIFSSLSHSQPPPQRGGEASPLAPLLKVRGTLKTGRQGVKETRTVKFESFYLKSLQTAQAMLYLCTPDNNIILLTSFLVIFL